MIDYYENKFNRATNTFSRFSQKNTKHEETLRDKDVKILH